MGSMNEESGKRGKGREKEELCKGPGAGKGWESGTIPTRGGELLVFNINLELELVNPENAGAGSWLRRPGSEKVPRG